MNKAKKGKTITTPKSAPKPVPTLPQKTYQEQERDVYQDYQRRKGLVRQKLVQSIPSSRLIQEKEQRQVEFLDVIQEKIYKNMIAIDPTSFKELVSMEEPPLCFQCAVFALKILISREEILGQMEWEDFQHSTVGKEIEFLGLIYGFQQLTLDGVFTRSNIMRAKNELLKYILEANISQWQEQSRQPYAQKFGVQIQNMVQLAENIIGFVEVYDSVMQAFALEGMKFNPKRKTEEKEMIILQLEDEQQQPNVPTQSLEHSPKPSDLESLKKVPKKRSEQKKSTPTATKSPQPLRPKVTNKKALTQSEVILRKKSRENAAVPEQQQISKLQSEIDEIHALLSRESVPEEKRERIISQLEPEQIKAIETVEAQPEPLEPKVLVKRTTINPKPIKQYYQTPQRVAKNSESDSKLNKLSPTKGNGSYTDESRNELYPNDVHFTKLQEAIKMNQQNIKQYVKEQMDIKWKIEKETKQLERNLERLQEYDEFLRQSQWRVQSMQAKQEQEKKDKEYKQDLKEFQKSGAQSRTESKQDEKESNQDLQINLKRFHQMLRNK